MKPIIKWAGEKVQLLPKIKELLPTTYNKYYEPFLGGGAVLLDLCPEEAVVNDINLELINMYNQIKYNCKKVIWELDAIDDKHECFVDPKQFYYTVRENFNLWRGSNTPEQAAKFIYLNKHCFNGLYRVNSKGEFNVPFNGKLTGKSYDKGSHLVEVSKQIQNVEFTCCDFTQVLAAAYSEEGSLVYLDPPYDPDEDIKTDGFVAYQKDGWGRHDTERLKSICDDLTAKGCKIILSNNDTAFIRELFKDYKIHDIDVHRSINRKSREVIITNY
jgi:DNA adenine methylase